MDRNEAIKRIRAALRQRTGKAWSVRGGRGTAWGWITITAPPKRRTANFSGDIVSPEGGRCMTTEDRKELGRIFQSQGGLAHQQGVDVRDSSEERRACVALAEGK